MTSSLALIAVLFILASQSAQAQFSKMEKKDPLSRALAHYNLEWKANNISTGTSLIAGSIWPRALFSNLEISESTQTKLLKTETLARTGDPDLNKNLQILKVSAHAFHERDIPVLVRAYLLGNGFDLKNQASIKMGRASVDAILPKFAGDLNQVLTIEATAVHRFDGENRKVYLTTFINKRNGKAVSFFIIEGKI